MTSVKIDGNRVSPYDAVLWAANKFGQSFAVQHEFPGHTWRFEFKTPEQATHFALKWA